MTLFVQDTFAEAKRLGVTGGFVGTYAALKQAVFAAAEAEADAADARAEAEAERAAELAACRALEARAGYGFDAHEDMYEWACAAELRDGEPPVAVTCCDGTGWTGNPRERCAEHYDVPMAFHC